MTSIMGVSGMVRAIPSVPTDGAPRGFVSVIWGASDSRVVDAEALGDGLIPFVVECCMVGSATIAG
jgi:hypothetical protein